MAELTMNVVGRVALVTGAGQGIGRAIAHALAAAGHMVVVNSLHRESAERTCGELIAKGCTALAAPADVADDEAVRTMVLSIDKHLGPIDILVNNAAAPAESLPLVETTSRQRNNELVTLLGTLNCTRHVCGAMISRRAGRIINISSIAGRHGMPLRAVYSAANAGIDAFTRAMAKELGPYGITVNGVSPGATESPRFQARSEAVRTALAQAIALGRFAEPQEIADAVAFLASAQANYINGAIIDVDGGFCGYPPPRF